MLLSSSFPQKIELLLLPAAEKSYIDTSVSDITSLSVAFLVEVIYEEVDPNAPNSLLAIACMDGEKAWPLGSPVASTALLELFDDMSHSKGISSNVHNACCKTLRTSLQYFLFVAISSRSCSIFFKQVLSVKLLDKDTMKFSFWIIYQKVHDSFGYSILDIFPDNIIIWSQK